MPSSGSDLRSRVADKRRLSSAGGVSQHTPPPSRACASISSSSSCGNASKQFDQMVTLGAACVGNVGFGLGLLAMRRVERGELVFEEPPVVVISTDPQLLMRDPEVSPLLMRCMSLSQAPAAAGDTSNKAKVRELMSSITEISAQRAYAKLPVASQQAWMELIDAFSIRTGGRVRIMGLSSAAGARMNGLEGTAGQYDGAKDRWSVKYTLDGVEGEVSMRAQNLDAPAHKTVGGVFRSNSYALSSTVGDDCRRPTVGSERAPMQAGLFAFLCRANHSCWPNVRKEFDEGGHVRVYATSVIEEGAEILSSYGFTAGLPVEGRREELKRRYCFYCECARCKAGHS